MPTRLIYAASETDADLLYASGFFAPDPFVWIQVGKVSHALLSDLELDRARSEGAADHVHALRDFLEKKAPPGLVSVSTAIASFLKKQRIAKVIVPGHFPGALACHLEHRGVRVEFAEGTFFPERKTKRAEEIQRLKEAQRLAEVGVARAVEILSASEIKGKGPLRWGGHPLTSERMQGEINAAIALRGGTASHTIVAGGVQACDPHGRGTGPLYPHQLIIVDVFPRVNATGYWGDITRTFVRGTPTELMQRLYEAVREVQAWAVRSVRAGADGDQLQKQALQKFAEKGWPTRIEKGRHVGFFHGLGHGLGLEIHESPRFAEGTLQAGTVITVEPGLYYPEVGGVRIEDVVAVTSTGSTKLTRFPKNPWIL
jgi:Xaa-Pro aminopeptidase